MRAYEGINDLQAMLDLLSTGGQADNGTHYVHRGDLQWWLFYNDDPPEVWQSEIRLWFEGDRLIGWSLLSPKQNAFDVFVQPDLRGDPCEAEMLASTAEEISASEVLENVWVEDKDDVRIRWFEENGFIRGDFHFVYFARSLDEPIDAARLPEGFKIRTSRGNEADAMLRSEASHAAFQSKKPFEEYWPRTLRFMQSPVYVPEHEIFVVSPRGSVASYCIVWTDASTGIGHFEPVGTEPIYHRMGLGKALLIDSLHRLKAEGMTGADVCTAFDNHAAIRLYESVGFRIVKKLWTYKRKRTP